MKQYKNSKGEDLPKEINEVVNAESQRLGYHLYKDSDDLTYAFVWKDSEYFKYQNGSEWENVWRGNYLNFYLNYKFKNAKGHIFPDEIQQEIYEEIKRQGLDLDCEFMPFSWIESVKEAYWEDTYYRSDYSQPTQPYIPKCGDMVEVSDDNRSWTERKFKFYDIENKGFVCLSTPINYYAWKHFRPIKTKVTIAELLEFYATAKGLNVDDLEQI